MRLRPTIIAALAAGALAALPLSAAASRTIVLTNDDGLTSNVVALYRALKAAGHDVIVSVPCTNQSGMGAALRIGGPLGPLAADCLNGAARAGEPGAGAMTRADLPQGDFFYVDGTPVMAMLFALDVAGKARWEAAPDLVLSGPNEGQNVGAIILSSGTVSNAQVAAVLGLPAIALSAGANTAGASSDGGDGLSNPLSAEVARRSVELVAALEERAGDGPLLPQGVALNVNFPDEMAGAQWRLSRIGSYNGYRVGFSQDMAADASPVMLAMARERGATIPALPGLSFAINDAPPTPAQQDDESVVYRQHIAISPMQAGYQPTPANEAWLGWHLHALLPPGEE